MRFWQRFIWVIALLILWEACARRLGSHILFPSPLAIFTYTSNNLGLLSRAVAATTQNAVEGFIWGNIAAIAMASLALMAPRSERVISTLALVVFCLPIIAVGPILRVIAGPGDTPQIALAALAVYYTTYLALLVGLRAIPQNWTDLIAIYGRGSLTALLIIRARASLPFLFVGLQIAAPAAFLGAMIGEFTGAERGLGVLTLRSMRGLNVEATWAIAIIAASLSLFAYMLIKLLGAWLVGYVPVLILSPRTTSTSAPLWWRTLDLLGASVLVILLWQLTMDLFDLNRFFAKRPLDVWSYLTTNSEARGTLLTALRETFAVAVPGYLAGLTLGASLAISVTLLPTLSSVILPLCVALRAIPIITTAPLIILALGRGSAGTTTVVATMIFFPTFVACLQGLRQTPGQITDLFKSYGASQVRLLMTAQIPAMLPALFAAAKMAIPAAILAVTTTEWLATGQGLGLLMALTATTSNYNMLWSCVVLITVTATLLYALVSQIERAVLKTYASEQVT